MSAGSSIDTYSRGWELGDAALSLGATASSFRYDAPGTGRIALAEFLKFADLKCAAGEMEAKGSLIKVGNTAVPNENIFYFLRRTLPR